MYINKNLYNVDIEQFLLSLPLPYFKGVYSSDNIPLLNTDVCFIVNLSNVSEIGSHFITICKIKDTLLILDSLALNWLNDNLREYIKHLKHTCKKLLFLKTPLQFIKSKGCGMYCIFFILWLHLSLYNKLPNILSFKKNLILNDKICEKNIRKLLQQLQNK